MPDQVTFDRGRMVGLIEKFPLGGGEVVDCLVIQPVDGSPATRVKADSPEADALRENNPELKGLGSSTAADEKPAADEAKA